MQPVALTRVLFQFQLLSKKEDERPQFATSTFCFSF